MKTHTLLLATAALVCAACASERYVGSDFVLRSYPPVAVEVGGGEIVLPVGIAIEVAVESYWDEGNETTTTTPILTSADQAIVGVTPSTSGGWVVYGIRQGETEIWVQSRGATRQTIPVRITAQ